MWSVVSESVVSEQWQLFVLSSSSLCLVITTTDH